MSGGKSEDLLQLAFLVKMSCTSDLFSLRVLKKGDRWLDNLYHLACSYIWGKKEEKRKETERDTDRHELYISEQRCNHFRHRFAQATPPVCVTKYYNGNFKLKIGIGDFTAEKLENTNTPI